MCTICTSCDILGALGTCTPLPKSVEDLVNHCEINTACDGADGGCVLAMNIGHFGDACTADTGCFNGICQGGFCKLANGDFCADDIACGSNHCSGYHCVGCTTTSTGGTDCADVDATCIKGVCTLPGGSPCAADSDCAGQSCLGGFCVESGSEACTAAGCITHFCNAGACETCASTPPNDECPLGTACMGGNCLAPPGAFCTQSSQCASGTCGPAALLDFPKCQ
jgi:hypothetical protein